MVREDYAGIGTCSDSSGADFLDLPSDDETDRYAARIHDVRGRGIGALTDEEANDSDLLLSACSVSLDSMGALK